MSTYRDRLVRALRGIDCTHMETYGDACVDCVADAVLAVPNPELDRLRSENAGLWDQVDRDQHSAMEQRGRADAAVALLRTAMTIRMYGERAPGGNENWADWDREAECFLREHDEPSRRPLVNDLRAEVYEALESQPALLSVDAAVDAVITKFEAELDRLREERDQAIAHDRQPYPTQWAYDQAVAALNKHRERADRLTEENTRLAAELAESEDRAGKRLQAIHERDMQIVALQEQLRSRS